MTCGCSSKGVTSSVLKVVSQPFQSYSPVPQFGKSGSAPSARSGLSPELK